MIFVFFRSIKCTEFAVNIADIRVIDISIDNVSDNLAAAAFVQFLFDQIAPRIRKDPEFLKRPPIKLERFLAAFPDFTPEPPPAENGVDLAPFLDGAVFRSFPHRHDTDAFFAVRLVRR